MNQIKVRAGQTLADIAVQEYGAFEAAVDLAVENGISITDDLVGGDEITPVDKTYNLAMEQYCKNNNVSPATK